MKILEAVKAVFHKLGGLGGAQRFLHDGPVAGAAGLLRRIAAVEVGGARRFVAKDHLVKAGVVWAGDNFKRFFLDMVEENVGGTTLFVHRLERASLDAPILAELGERAQISLAHFFELLEKQAKGESGPLLTNGCANLAYIIGSDGNFWAAGASWRDDGWRVYARSVEYPLRWYGGCQVLSR